ncbi:SDR family oxidoreductase [Paenibacillus sp. FSL R7-0331]|uniref:SDR family oxidoreductase n=1 Tax=Paenibacillus sp. FSL R7-0331 TaxID=1536773 RepID=UPI0004F92871|nr:SDR family oxidoreductase [Paenibacillus sp. FSL R7-0331]AIQ54111.1 short-chain dehydrogenase [Paenibacillus sp. FSL R7-0331]
MTLIQWAFVTGADRGVGLSLVKGLLEKGYHVFAGQYAGAEAGSELELLETACKGSLKCITLDISDADSVRKALEAVAAVTGRLDILINNGAVLGDMQATVEDELDFEEMDRVFRVNALGALRMSNGLIQPLLRSEHKLIVNISSEAGSIGSCWRNAWYAYCMSKAALNMQSQLIHNQIAPKGGKVMVVHPGHVQTYMQGKLDTAGKLTPDESAGCILELIGKRLDPGYAGEGLTLMDYAGETLPW